MKLIKVPGGRSDHYSDYYLVAPYYPCWT